MKVGNVVKVTGGEHAGRTGTIITPDPFSPALDRPAKRRKTDSAESLWMVAFDLEPGGKQSRRFGSVPELQLEVVEA